MCQLRFEREGRSAGRQARRAAATGLALALLGPTVARASSHREAPFVTEHPKVDATDFYLFNSYEPGREGYVVVVANYIPLQAPYGGPNYFMMDPDALYEIHIDNNGDAREDLTFQFRFNNELQNIALDIGPAGQTRSVSVPVINVGPIAAGDTGALNVRESYSVNVVRGDRRRGESQPVENTDTGSRTFAKPVDNIGNKSIPDYDAYARAHVYNITIPGCSTPGRMFVGQRKDPFVVNLGETFDLVNISNPLGPVDAETDDLADANVTSLVLELPVACLTAGGDPVIGGWTTASLRQARVLDPTPSFERPAIEGGAFVQVSRLASPLVNELVIGLRDKDRFNASQPRDDGQFADYVTHPTLPAILEILFGGAGVRAPTLFPRSDLVNVFLQGVEGLNRPASNNVASEMMRLNTGIPAVAASQQNNLGVIGGDAAGYPNGRRPGDDVVDISLRAVMGVLLSETDAPSGPLAFTDGALVNASMFDTTFPFLRTPLPGSPNRTPATSNGQ